MAGGAGNDGKRGDDRMSGVMIVVLVGAVAALIFGGVPLLSYIIPRDGQPDRAGRDGQQIKARPIPIPANGIQTAHER